MILTTLCTNVLLRAVGIELAPARQVIEWADLLALAELIHLLELSRGCHLPAIFGLLASTASSGSCASASASGTIASTATTATSSLRSSDLGLLLLELLHGLQLASLLDLRELGLRL